MHALASAVRSPPTNDSRHQQDKPTIFVIGAGMTVLFGKAVGKERQGRALLAAMVVLFVGGVTLTWYRQSHPSCHRRCWGPDGGAHAGICRQKNRGARDEAGSDRDCNLTFGDPWADCAGSGYRIGVGWPPCKGTPLQTSFRLPPAPPFKDLIT
jgi:hypothetical protein